MRSSYGWQTLFVTAMQFQNNVLFQTSEQRLCFLLGAGPG